MTRVELRRFFLSLRGHIVLLGGPAFVAFTLVFLQQARVQGWLTWGSALRIVVAGALGGVVTAALIWYAIIRPTFLAEQARHAGRR